MSVSTVHVCATAFRKQTVHFLGNNNIGATTIKKKKKNVHSDAIVVFTATHGMCYRKF